MQHYKLRRSGKHIRSHAIITITAGGAAIIAVDCGRNLRLAPLWSNAWRSDRLPLPGRYLSSLGFGIIVWWRPIWRYTLHTLRLNLSPSMEPHLPKSLAHQMQVPIWQTVHQSQRTCLMCVLWCDYFCSLCAGGTLHGMRQKLF